MRRDKQIKDMARILREANGVYKYAENYFMPDARVLYRAGYRKASEVAGEIFEEIEKCTIRRVVRDGKIVFDSTEQFAELKKKYTEGGE